MLTMQVKDNRVMVRCDRLEDSCYSCSPADYDDLIIDSQGFIWKLVGYGVTEAATQAIVRLMNVGVQT
jgi:hypothetical protein